MCVIFHEKLRQTEAKARWVHRGIGDQGTASVTSTCLQYKQLCVCMHVWKTCHLCLVEKKKNVSFSTVSVETKNFAAKQRLLPKDTCLKRMLVFFLNVIFEEDISLNPQYCYILEKHMPSEALFLALAALICKKNVSLWNPPACISL